MFGGLNPPPTGGGCPIGGIMMLRLNEYDDAGLIRLYRIVYRKVDSLMRGDPWGWDMPTLGVLYPQLHLALREIIAEGRKRGL